MTEQITLTMSEIRTVIERSDLPIQAQLVIWVAFVDFATIDKRFNPPKTEDPTLFD